MKSRTLPACRTDAMVLRASRATPHDGYECWNAPTCRDAWYGHRLVLDDPPRDAEIWLDRWESHHADHGVARAYLVWEHRSTSFVVLPEGAELRQHRVMMHDTWVDPTRASDALRPLREDDGAALHQLTLGDLPDEPASHAYVRWYLDQLWEHRSSGHATLWGSFRDGRLVGTASMVWDRREARLQNVIVAESQRREGLGSALVNACVGDYRAHSSAIAYLVTELDSPAEALYRALGFRHVTWFWELSRPSGS